jgi:hypothetical protein
LLAVAVAIAETDLHPSSQTLDLLVRYPIPYTLQTLAHPLVYSPTTLTNDYFKLLLDEKWQRRNWKGPPQLEDKKTKSLMMVSSALLCPFLAKSLSLTDAAFTAPHGLRPRHRQGIPPLH